MEEMYFLSAFVSSIGFWICLSLVAVLVITNNMKTQGLGDIDLSTQYVSPGTVADKASCRVGVEEACKKAASEGERLACTHKKLVNCYATKRIPDGVEPEHITKGGEKGRCAGVVAYASNGPFSNRTVFPVCMAKGQYFDIPKGHPYRYTIRNNPQWNKYYMTINSTGYIVPSGKRTGKDGHPEYVLPSGDTLPYGLTEHLVRLERDYGYEVFPVYTKKNDTLVQADLSDVSFRFGRV